MVAHIDDPTNTMVVQFPDQAKIGVDKIKEYFKRMKEESIPHSILVVQTGLTPAARDVKYNLTFVVRFTFVFARS
jgi:hypothetical protein